MQHDAADKKKHNKIQASYTLEGTVLENVESIKYLGVTITVYLKWNSHIRNVCSKANRSNRKAMNRNWSNQKANPALKTKAGNK